MRSSAAAHGTPQTVWQRYFYRHGRFFATYQASMLLLTVACIAVLILPPFFHLVHTAWVRREIPYTFTPISSYLRDANFFARANAEPMLLWQTVKLAPSLAAVNTSAEGDGGARVPTSRDTLYSLTRSSLSYLLRFQHLLETCEVSLAEVEALSRDSDLDKAPVPYEPQLPHPLDSPVFRLSDICYRTTPEARCLVLSPAVYWDYNQQQLMEDPDLAATVRRRSADLVSARGVHAPPEMLWENLRLGGNDPTAATSCTDGHPGCPAIDTVSSPLPIPVTVEGFHLAVAAVETWSHSVPARAVLQTLIHHVVARLDAVPLNCTGSDDAFKCPTLPPATLHLDPRDRTVRALFQTDYSKFAVEHYFLAVGCLGLFAYIYYTFYRLDLVKSKIWLGIATTLMLVCSMFLALTICTSVSRAHPLLPWEILPFFVIIVGVENVHAITQSVVQLPFDLPVRERIGLGLSHVGPTMLFRLLAEVAGLTLGVGLSTEIVREFCIFLILSIIVDFVFQVTFFITVLSIDIRRLELSDLYHRRRQSHSGGEHASTADPTHPHTLAAASSSSTSSSGFRGRPYDKSFSAMLLRAPAIVFRHLHRLWMRQRAYSIFLLVAFVGLLYYLYDHTSHAVNIIFPAQENAFISNLLLRDSAQILGQVMAGFHSIEVSRRLVVRYLLSYPTHRAYLQALPAAAAVGSRGGEAHALWTTASLGRWGLILRPLALVIDVVAAGLPALIRRWSLPYWLVVIWAAVAMVLVVLAVRGIIRGRGYRPTPHPLWRLLAPVGLATASHGPDVRIDHAGAVDLNPGFLTDLRALRPWGRHHVLTISQDGICALQTMRDLAGYVSGGPVFSRWRTVAEADRMATPPSLLAGLPADLTHRRSDPRFATDYSRRWGALTLDGLKVYLWAASAESSTTTNVEGTFFSVPTADVAHTLGPVTCLALLHNVGANDRWELHSEPPSAPAMRKPLTSTPVLAVGRANGSLEFYVIDEVACNVQRMAEARLPSAPCAQVWASANYSVCADLAGGIHVLYLAQTPGLPATLSALYSLDVQRDSVTALTLTPTCPDLLITGHRSGAVHIWNLATAYHVTALSRGGSRPGSPNLPDLNTFAWPPASLSGTASTGPSSLPYPTATSPFPAPFALPSTTPGADGHVAVLGSPHHTAAVRRLLVYPELNGLRNVTRLFVVSAGDDSTAHVWQITREEYYQRPPSPSSSATFQPTGPDHASSRSLDLSPILSFTTASGDQTTGTTDGGALASLAAVPAAIPATLTSAPPKSPRQTTAPPDSPTAPSPPPHTYRRKSWHREMMAGRLPLSLAATVASGAPLGLSALHLVTVSQPGSTTVAHWGNWLVGVCHSPAVDPASATPDPLATHSVDNGTAAGRSPATAPPAPSTTPDSNDPASARLTWSLWLLNLVDLRLSDDDKMRQQLDHSYAVCRFPLASTTRTATSSLGELLAGTPWFGAAPQATGAATLPSSTAYVGTVSSIGSRKRRVTPGGPPLADTLGNLESCDSGPSHRPGTPSPTSRGLPGGWSRVGSGEGDTVEMQPLSPTAGPSRTVAPTAEDPAGPIPEAVSTVLPPAATGPVLQMSRVATSARPTPYVKVLGDPQLPFTSIHQLSIIGSPAVAEPGNPRGPQSFVVLIGIGNLVRCLPVDIGQ